MANIPKIIFGNQTATKGGKSDCSAITPNTLSKKHIDHGNTDSDGEINSHPTTTLYRRYCNCYDGKYKYRHRRRLHFLYLTTSYRPMLEDPRAFSFSIKSFN